MIAAGLLKAMKAMQAMKAMKAMQTIKDWLRLTRFMGLKNGFSGFSP
jgi:hypothetical protein